MKCSYFHCVYLRYVDGRYYCLMAGVPVIFFLICPHGECRFHKCDYCINVNCDKNKFFIK